MIGETQKTIIAVVLAILCVGVIAEVSLRMLPAQEEPVVPTGVLTTSKPEPTPDSIPEPAPERDSEFPSWIFFPILIVSTIAVIVIRNKIRKKGLE